MFFSITNIFFLFLVYIILYFAIIKNLNNNYYWCKILGLVITFSIYLIILDFLFYFDCLSTKFQNLEHFFLFSNIVNASNLTYGIDGISIIFLLLVSIIIPLIIIINWEQSLFPLFLLNNILFLEFCLLNLFWVLDIFFFFFFFEASLIPMFLIIGVFGSRQRKKRASLLFFLYSLFGSFFLLFGILIIFFETGSSDFSVILNFNFSLLKQKILWVCFFVSFGSKFPLYPFHIWLPEAHVEAPTSGSIVLAAILLKIGAYGVLRFMLPILPLANNFFNSFIYLISLLTIFIASWVAFRQIDTKKIIAYSSISHMGLGFLGLFSNNIYGLAGSIFLMICHGFVSSGLFFTAGLLYERFYTRHIFEYGGLCTTMPIFTLFFFLFTLANIGLPGFGNFLAEILLLYGIFLKKNILILLIIFIGLLVTVIYSFWLYSRIVFGTLKLYKIHFNFLSKTNSIILYKNKKIFLNTYYCSYLDLSRREFFIFLILLVYLFLLGIYPQFFFNYFYANLKLLLV